MSRGFTSWSSISRRISLAATDTCSSRLPVLTKRQSARTCGRISVTKEPDESGALPASAGVPFSSVFRPCMWRSKKSCAKR